MPLAPEQSPPQETSLEIAEERLLTARSEGDAALLVTALTDLGILLSHEGKCKRAIELLEEALQLARAIGVRDKERDVLGNLGTALASKDPTRALRLVNRELELAREAKEPFAEKIALGHLGTLYLRAQDPAQAVICFKAARTIARLTGDRQHEAELLWLLAVGHAELGEPHEADTWAQAAIDLFTEMGKPQAVLLREHLDKFKTGAVGRLRGSSAAGPGESSAVFATEFFVASGFGTSGNSLQQSGRIITGSNWLRMGFSAVKSLVRFVGSGMKRVPLRTYQERQVICGTCEHHTGLRCKLCGCFTRVKAWLPHEECPTRKWPKA